MSAFLTILPFAFKIFGFILGRAGASQDSKNAFTALINSCQKDGLIPIKQTDISEQQDKDVLDVTKKPQS